MDPQLFSNILFQTASPNYLTSTISPGTSGVRNYRPPSPDTPAVKQTWEEFCLEQEQQRLNVPANFRLSTSNYRQPYPSNARSASNNRWANRRSQSQDTQLDPDATIRPRKKKKPLSQNTPAKREWSLADAERALQIEKECNKRSKTSLIIKFPDLELNREIVAAFHSEIENVHFQQPSTPRFCFVTLKESANTDEVLAALNKQKFGDSYLVAEHKKDREDDQNVTGKDVDPFTLYVGNLAQEITKEEMLQLYPNSKRIDIGYAKKMKYTRYAFVVFHTIDSAIEAFQRTFSKQIYNKSLIVRFRRLHGNVGMPGDSRQQNPPATQTPEKTTNETQQPSITEDVVEIHRDNFTPFSINVKQESETDSIFGDEKIDYEDLHEIHSTHRPRYIKVENDNQTEEFEYVVEDSKEGIKQEFKREYRYSEPEFHEISDVELEDSDYHQEDGYR